MTDLTTFRDHCRTLADTGHGLDCPARTAHVEWVPYQGRVKRPDVECAGCVTQEDRTRFAALAAEIDTYLGRDDEPLTDLFAAEAAVSTTGGDG